MTRLALALLPFAFPIPAAADVATVQDMIPGCEEAATYSAGRSQPSDDAIFCLGTASGLAALLDHNCIFLPYLNFTAPVEPLFLKGSIPPSNAAAAQGFVNWARQHPEEWKEDFFISFAKALAETFPCQPAPAPPQLAPPSSP